MSNPTGAFGLKPVRHFGGSPWNGATQKCYISSSYATALFIGDPVVIDNESDDKDTSGKYPTIEQASETATNPVHGVITSFCPLVTDLNKTYNPASTERYANVCMAPDIIYQIRDSGDGTPDKTWIGANADLASGSGSTTTGLSGFTLQANSNAPAADITYQLLIIGLANREDISLADYGLWEVLLNTLWTASGNRLGVMSG